MRTFQEKQHFWPARLGYGLVCVLFFLWALSGIVQIFRGPRTDSSSIPLSLIIIAVLLGISALCLRRWMYWSRKAKEWRPIENPLDSLP